MERMCSISLLLPCPARISESISVDPAMCSSSLKTASFRCSIQCAKGSIHLEIPPPPPSSRVKRDRHKRKKEKKGCNLITAARRLRARATASTLLVAAAHAKPLLSGEKELALEVGRGVLAVDEVAEAAADAALAAVEAAAGLAEVGDGAQLAVDGPSGVPARVELVAGALGRVLVLEARVDVAHQVVVGVVADHELLELPVPAQLAPQVLVEGVEVVRALLRRQPRLRVVRRVLVHARQQDRLAVRGLHVLPRAPVPVPARPDLVVERAVHLVLLRPEDGGEEVRHFFFLF